MSDRMNIQSLVEEFYAIESIMVLLSDKTVSGFNPARHSHIKWEKEFNEFRTAFNSTFAEAIHDYTALVVAGEMRHARKHSTMYIKDFLIGGGRNDSYENCQDWSSQSILKAGVQIFSEDVRWDNGYGGIKWKVIAEAGLMYGKVSNVVFIDHCVDLSHNNSVYFDKGAGIFSMAYGNYIYAQFLDKKREAPPMELINRMHGDIYKSFLSRAIALGILPEINVGYALYDDRPYENRKSETRRSEYELFNYCSVCWGNNTLSRELYNSGHYVSIPEREIRNDSDGCDGDDDIIRDIFAFNNGFTLTKAEFSVGNKVIVHQVFGFNTVHGSTGTTIYYNSASGWLVEFDRNVRGHDGDGKGKKGHCLWVNTNDMCLDYSKTKDAQSA